VVFENVDVKDGFVEQDGHADWESIGTITGLAQFRELYVRLVILGSEVLAIPTRWKRQLEA
jgi:hypothetical protein